MTQKKNTPVRFECVGCHLVLEAPLKSECEGEDGSIVEEGPLYASAFCPNCQEWRIVFDDESLAEFGLNQKGGVMRYYKCIGDYPDGVARPIFLKGTGGGPGTHARGFSEPPCSGKIISVPIRDVKKISRAAYEKAVAQIVASMEK